MGKWQGPVGIPEYFHTFLHSFTFVILDDEGKEYKIVSKIKHLPSTPGWRNWQTQRTQNPPDFGPWGFDSPSRHQPLHLCLVMVYEFSWFRGADGRKWPTKPST